LISVTHNATALSAVDRVGLHWRDANG
jgi:hypothetical protein